MEDDYSIDDFENDIEIKDTPDLDLEINDDEDSDNLDGVKDYYSDDAESEREDSYEMYDSDEEEGNGEFIGTKMRLRKKKVSVPKLFIYEKTKLLAYRSQQLENNAKARVDVSKMTGELNPYTIALEELKQKVLPFTVKRKFPDNTYELWKLTEFLNI